MKPQVVQVFLGLGSSCDCCLYSKEGPVGAAGAVNHLPETSDLCLTSDAAVDTEVLMAIMGPESAVTLLKFACSWALERSLFLLPLSRPRIATRRAIYLGMPIKVVPGAHDKICYAGLQINIKQRNRRGQARASDAGEKRDLRIVGFLSVLRTGFFFGSGEKTTQRGPISPHLLLDLRTSRALPTTVGRFPGSRRVVYWHHR